MSEATRRVRSATHFRDRLDAVVDCTLWCLGCDVRYADGNLLVAGGFARSAPPPGLGPRLSRGSLATPCWTTDDYPQDVTPATADARSHAARLLRGLADEIEARERWITSHVGSAYRAACDADRPRHVRRRQRLPAAWLAEAWDTLATSYAVLLTTKSDQDPASGADTPPPSTPPSPAIRLASTSAERYSRWSGAGCAVGFHHDS